MKETFLQIDRVLFIICAFLAVPACFVEFTLPLITNRKFNPRWKSYISKKTHYTVSDVVPYGLFGRAFMYAEAAVSEKRAQKLFGVSSQEFRSHLNGFQLFYCRLGVWAYRVLAFSIIYFGLTTAIRYFCGIEGAWGNF